MRGVDRWIVDTRSSRPPRKRVILIMLGAYFGSMDEAQGAIRQFWHRMRDRYGPLTYFSWMELTAKGLPHYHAMVVDPPFRRNWDSKKRMERYWSPDLTERIVRTQQKPAEWFNAGAAAYVAKYAAKFGDKSYQQDYDDVPSTIRTFECSRLVNTVGEIDPHLPTFDVVCLCLKCQGVADHARRRELPSGRWVEVHAEWWLVARLWHAECAGPGARAPSSVGAEGHAEPLERLHAERTAGRHRPRVSAAGSRVRARLDLRPEELPWQ